MGKNKHKIQNTQIIRELKGYEKGKRHPSDRGKRTTNVFTGDTGGSKSQ